MFAMPCPAAPRRSSRPVSHRLRQDLAPVFASVLVACLVVWGASPALARAAASDGSPAASPSFDGRWDGAIQIPGQALEIEVELESTADEPSGTIRIPAQGIEGQVLSGFDRDGGSLRFSIPGIPGDPTFDGSLRDGEDGAPGAVFAGLFSQGGGTFGFVLERVESAAAARAALVGDGGDDAESLDAVIEQALVDFEVPGLGLAVVSGGEVVWAKGYGLRDVERELPMTADTLFPIGSTTKAMTATLLGTLVDEGRLEWDEPLVRRLPEFRLADPEITRRITPLDLLTHRSGMPRHDLLWYGEQDATRAELIERFEHLELTADLREQFQYNNLMYMTAGHLAGVLTDSTWEDALRERLLEPLGMDRTNTSVDASQRDADFALPYDQRDDEVVAIPFRRIDVVGPAGSVNSSVAEMARWLLFNLELGRVDGEQLIDPSTLETIHSPHMTVGGPSPGSRVQLAAYGLGWFVAVEEGHRMLQHGGGIDGFTTSVVLYPDDDLGLVAFTNRPSSLPGLITEEAADRILGREGDDGIAKALKEQQQAESVTDRAEAEGEDERIEGTSPSRDLDAYTGSYDDPGYGTVTVERVGDRLEIEYHGLRTPLEHWHYDVWRGRSATDGESDAESESDAEAADPVFDGTRFAFRGDFDGQITELVAPLELLAAPIVFTKQADPRLRDPEFLERFVGTYAGLGGQQLRIVRTATTLTAHLAGQPTFTLVPRADGRFDLEGLNGFSMAFDFPENAAEREFASGVRSIQPNGVFEFNRVEID